MPGVERTLLPLLYAATLLLSALLLFWIQPLVAKLLLPILGGTPAVWNTCLLFFQTMLLGGYAYAFLVTRRLALRNQILLHLALLVAAALLLPQMTADFATRAPDAEQSPALWLLRTLSANVGVPFLVLSASAPLLQKWFAQTRHAAARDPYFLYAASNAGSLFALLLFPLVFEPTMSTRGQTAVWAGGYVALVLLAAACAWAAWRGRRGDEQLVSKDQPGGEIEEERLTWTRRLRWLALAFVPSSLVLGVTTFITTDVAAVPLLWTLPLAIYLLTFVLAFARRQFVSIEMLARVAAGAGVLATLVLLSGATEPTWFLVLVHLAFLFFAALALHTRLAASRPAPAALAEYYLWLSLGGALGGAFNAIVAPLVFTRTLEYPLAIVLACLLLPLRGRRETERETNVIEAEEDVRSAIIRDLARGVCLGALTAALAFVVMRIELGTLERIAIALGVPLLILNHMFTTHARRFGIGLAGVMLASSLLTLDSGAMLHAERSFYGTLRVTRDEDTTKFYHGSTLHGRQFIDAARRCEPLSYYHREGPLGEVFKAFDTRGTANANVAVVGLGTGATAAYSRADQTWTFYELDPAIARLARDERYFSYLSACAATPVSVVLGDARLRLREASDAGYDLIVLDAFSSDAVPVHLLTREAFALYLAKLKRDGWLALHVSNRSLDLHQVVSRLAHDAELQAYYFDDPRYEPRRGLEPSQWIVVARLDTDLSTLTADECWRALPTNENAPLWRDDFSSIVSVFKIK